MSAQLRQQAARRRAKLLNEGNERIEQLRLGPDSERTNRSSTAMNNHKIHNITVGALPDKYSFSQFRQSPERLTGVDPQTLFSGLSFPSPIEGLGEAQTSLNEETSFRLKRSKLIEAIKAPLVFIIGCIAVLISTVLKRILQHREGESSYKSYFFYEMNTICTVIFCFLEIVIQLFIIAPQNINPSMLFTPALVLPLFQLITEIMSSKQMLILVLSGSGLAIAYIFIRFQEGVLTENLIGLFLTNSLTLLGFFSVAKSYISDYAIYCVANASTILLVSLVGRCFGL